MIPKNLDGCQQIFLKIFNLRTTYDIFLLRYNGYLSKIGLPPLHVEECLCFIGHTKRL